jgi:hypothetical protein
MAKLTLRIDDDELHQRLEAAASEDERSVNGEIIWLIRVGLEWRLVDRGARSLSSQPKKRRTKTETKENDR